MPSAFASVPRNSHPPPAVYSPLHAEQLDPFPARAAPAPYGNGTGADYAAVDRLLASAPSGTIRVRVRVRVTRNLTLTLTLTLTPTST